MLPKNWKQIKVDQYVELRSLREEDFGSLFLFNIELLAIVMDTEADELDDLTSDELTENINALRWIGREPVGMQNSVMHYNLVSLKRLSLGEFIDLEHYFANDYIKNLTNICAIRYRKADEKYNYDPTDRANEFNELPITDVYGIIPEYLKFREEFIKAYENLFMPDIEETDDLDAEDKKEEEEEKRVQKWSWERVIYDLCNGDITKTEQVTELPLVMVFNFLSMKHELKI